MERIISPEERVRRAEQIYYRRKLNSNNVRMPSSQVKEGKEKRPFSLYRKMLIQILLCVLIYLIFSLIKEANYLFSESVINRTKEFLSSDINFELIWGNVSNFFEASKDKFGFKPTDQNSSDNNLVVNEETNSEIQNAEETNKDDTNSQQQNIENNQEITKNEIQNNELDIKNEEISNEQTVNTSSQGSSKKNQMEIDAQYIKENFKMQVPVKARITSHYGEREPTPIVSANHQGIDLGVPEGTSIVSAIDGKVSLVAENKDYGIYVKVVKDDITTVYAHCSKIVVKKDQTVKKGQKIALSGNTGKTTGPHLHFEVQRSGRTIDPELILDWG